MSPVSLPWPWLPGDFPTGSFEERAQQNMEALALAVPNPATATPFRMVRGSVKADGTIVRGTGFTVTKTATGEYTITFDTPFATVPIVVVSNVSWVAAAQEASRTVSSFHVVTFVSTTGASTDLGFDFIAVTP